MSTDIKCEIHGGKRCDVGQDNGYPCYPDKICPLCKNTGLKYTYNYKGQPRETIPCNCCFGDHVHRKLKGVNA